MESKQGLCIEGRGFAALTALDCNGMNVDYMVELTEIAPCKQRTTPSRGGIDFKIHFLLTSTVRQRRRGEAYPQSMAAIN
jgi:hypothetical protein